MVNDKRYTVNIGVFLFVVLSALKEISKLRGYNNKGITEPKCVEALINIVDDEAKYALNTSDISTVLSKVKSCKCEIPDWMKIKQECYWRKLDDLVTSDYQTLLCSITKWSNQYLDLVDHGNWLCRVLLELVYFDDGIDNNTEIYAKVDGSKISIEELVDSDEIHIQALLLGLWHFFVCERLGVANSAGKPTIESISESNTKKAKRKIRNTIGYELNFHFDAHILNLEKLEKTDEKRAVNSIYDDQLLFRDGDEREIIDVGNSLIGLSDDEISLPEIGFEQYFESLRMEMSCVKTLLFHNEARDFKSIYYPNDICKADTYVSSNRYGVISDPTIAKLAEVNNYLIITGKGGLGKSMMMRNLTLDAIDHFQEYKLVPVYIPLKDYRNPCDNLIDFIYDNYKNYEGALDKKGLKKIISSGRLLMLFDGIDEIKSDVRESFQLGLKRLITSHKGNFYIMSSRPNSLFVSYYRFTNLKLLPFTKDQALRLIDKLDLGKHDQGLKCRFYQEIKNTLFETHKAYAENPLLLTIMLLTYKEKTVIPSEMHKFYAKAYETLYSEHDKSKDGYERELQTKLKQDKFAEYFSEFCFLAYQEEDYDPEEISCEKYFNEMDIVEEEKPKFGYKEFLHDLEYAACLMYMEGLRYHFIHRSMQEYFTACYFFRQPPSMLPEIGEFFEENPRDNDNTFAMLYAMEPRAVEEQIIIPFLDKLFIDDKQESIIPRYDNFLIQIYPFLYINDRDVGYEYDTKPDSFIYSFLLQKLGLPVSKNDLWFEDYEELEEFVLNEYVYYDTDFKVLEDKYGCPVPMNGEGYELALKSDVSEEYLDYFDMPETAGITYEIDIEKILSDSEKCEYSATIQDLYSDTFPLMIEFNKMYEYYRELKKKKSEKKESLHERLKRKKKEQI